MATSTADVPWYEQVFNTVGEKLGQALDFHINDWLDLPSQYAPVQGLGGNPYPEATPPINPQPTEPGFKIGNNAPTYAAGAALLLLGVLVYKAVK